MDAPDAITDVPLLEPMITEPVEFVLKKMLFAKVLAPFLAILTVPVPFLLNVAVPR